MGHLPPSTGLLILAVILGAGCDRSEPPSAPGSGTAPSPPAQATSPTAPSASADDEMPSPTLVEGERKPTPATQASANIPDVPAFLPLLDAKPGEWAEYAALRGRMLRYEVEQVTVATVSTRVIIVDGGKPLGQPATREDLRESDLLARQAEQSRATRTAERTRVSAGGREREALLYEDRWVDEDVEYVRRTWVDAAVPVFGIIRMELHGNGQLEARLELTASSAER